MVYTKDRPHSIKIYQIISQKRSKNAQHQHRRLQQQTDHQVIRASRQHHRIRRERLPPIDSSRPQQPQRASKRSSKQARVPVCHNPLVICPPCHPISSTSSTIVKLNSHLTVLSQAPISVPRCLIKNLNELYKPFSLTCRFYTCSRVYTPKNHYKMRQIWMVSGCI